MNFCRSVFGTRRSRAINKDGTTVEKTMCAAFAEPDFGHSLIVFAATLPQQSYDPAKSWSNLAPITVPA